MNLKIAIVGAGFCGIAAAWELSKIKNARIDLFDLKGIGGGASGIAAGLLHPYPGEQGRKSWKADEAMKATLELIGIAEKKLGKVVADRSGIVKKGTLEKIYDDVVSLEKDIFLIKSGVTVYSQIYLEGLWLACQEKGVNLKIQKFQNLQELEGYDKIVLTTGVGVFSFKECGHLKLGKTKGQILLCQGVAPDRSIVGKGYIAKSEVFNRFYVGSTYERDPNLSEEPSLQKALEDLQPKMSVLRPELGNLDIIACRAAFRVSPLGHYIPLIEKINKNTFVITAMGSRGLLYHAFFAKLLKEKIEIA